MHISFIHPKTCAEGSLGQRILKWMDGRLDRSPDVIRISGSISGCGEGDVSLFLPQYSYDFYHQLSNILRVVCFIGWVLYNAFKNVIVVKWTDYKFKLLQETFWTHYTPLEIFTNTCNTRTGAGPGPRMLCDQMNDFINSKVVYFITWNRDQH